jgi:hypothetical protein
MTVGGVRSPYSAETWLPGIRAQQLEFAAKAARIWTRAPATPALSFRATVEGAVPAQIHETVVKPPAAHLGRDRARLIPAFAEIALAAPVHPLTFSRDRVELAVKILSVQLAGPDHDDGQWRAAFLIDRPFAEDRLLRGDRASE